MDTQDLGAQDVDNAVVSAIKVLNARGIDSLQKVEKAPVGIHAKPVTMAMPNLIHALQGENFIAQGANRKLVVADTPLLLTRSVIRKIQVVFNY